MSSKPVNTDNEPLELVDGWDREEGRPAPQAPADAPADAPAADGWDDWDTPLDDITWEEPSVKKTAGQEAGEPEEALPPITGETLAELLETSQVFSSEVFLVTAAESPGDPADRENEVDPFADSGLLPGQAANDEAGGAGPAPPEPEIDELDPLDFKRVMAQVSAPGPAGDEPAAELEDLDGDSDISKAKPAKVELDIEDMRLEDGPAEDDGQDGEDEPEEPVDPAPEPAVKKIPLLKLLVLLGPAVLLLAGLGFVGYRLFSSPPQESALTEGQLQDVWPEPPPAGPGDWPLEPFFFLLPGRQAYVPVEARITIFYDNPERLLDLKDDLVLYRDYIFRYIQNQDAGILTDQDRLEKLRHDLETLINQKSGAEVVTHLRLEFRR